MTLNGGNRVKMCEAGWSCKRLSWAETLPGDYFHPEVEKWMSSQGQSVLFFSLSNPCLNYLAQVSHPGDC